MKLSKRRQSKEESLEQGSAQIVNHPAVAATTFEAALGAFLDAQDAEGHSKVTQEDYKRMVNLFVRYMQSECGYTSIQQVLNDN